MCPPGSNNNNNHEQHKPKCSQVNSNNNNNTDRDADQQQQQQQWQSPQFEAKRNTFTLLKTNEAIEGSAQASSKGVAQRVRGGRGGARCRGRRHSDRRCCQPSRQDRVGGKMQQSFLHVSLSPASPLSLPLCNIYYHFARLSFANMQHVRVVATKTLSFA